MRSYIVYTFANELFVGSEGRAASDLRGDDGYPQLGDDPYSRAEMEADPRLREALERWERDDDDSAAWDRAVKLEKLCNSLAVEAEDILWAQGSLEEITDYLVRYDGFLPWEAPTRAREIIKERGNLASV